MITADEARIRAWVELNDTDTEVVGDLLILLQIIDELRGSVKEEDKELASVDWYNHAIIRDGQRIHLPPKEWKIFSRLVKDSGKLVTKDTLMDELYQLDPNGGANPKIIDVFICSLRKKCPWPIKTVWGRGYIIEGIKYLPAIPMPSTIAGITRERLMAGK
jgi:DNA-binding response OmpR family regulator